MSPKPAPETATSAKHFPSSASTREPLVSSTAVSSASLAARGEEPGHMLRAEQEERARGDARAKRVDYLVETGLCRDVDAAKAYADIEEKRARGQTLSPAESSYINELDACHQALTAARQRADAATAAAMAGVQALSQARRLVVSLKKELKLEKYRLEITEEYISGFAAGWPRGRDEIQYLRQIIDMGAALVGAKEAVSILSGRIIPQIESELAAAETDLAKLEVTAPKITEAA